MPADFQSFGEAQQTGWQRTKSSTADGNFMTVYELLITQDRQSAADARRSLHPPRRVPASQEGCEASTANECCLTI